MNKLVRALIGEDYSILDKQRAWDFYYKAIKKGFLTKKDLQLISEKCTIIRIKKECVDMISAINTINNKF